MIVVHDSSTRRKKNVYFNFNFFGRLAYQSYRSSCVTKAGRIVKLEKGEKGGSELTTTQRQLKEADNTVKVKNTGVKRVLFKLQTQRPPESVPKKKKKNATPTSSEVDIEEENVEDDVATDD